MSQELQINMSTGTSFNLFFWTHLHCTSDENALVILDELYQNYAKFCSDHQLPLGNKSSMGKSLCRLGFKTRVRIGELHGKRKIAACPRLAWIKGNVNPNYHLLTHSKSRKTSKISECKHIPKEEPRTPENEWDIPEQTPKIPECKQIIPKQEPMAPRKEFPEPTPEWKPVIKKQARRSSKLEKNTPEPKLSTSQQKTCVPKQHPKPITLEKPALEIKSKTSKQNQCNNKFKLKIKLKTPKTPEEKLLENECRRRQVQVDLSQSSKRYIMCRFTSKGEAAMTISSLGLDTTARVLPEQGAFFVRE